jgi:hypothetical protein
MIIEARAHVRITLREPVWRTIPTFFISFGSTYGPFLIDLDICYWKN